MSISEIITIIRNIINDNEVSNTDVFVATGTSSLFTLTEGNVNSIDSVLVNDVESGIEYVTSSDLVKVRIDSDLDIDDVVEVNYKCYSNYSDNEIIAYIKSAMVHLSVNKLNTYIVTGDSIEPEPEIAESNLIATIAGILINPQNVSYRLPDIGVTMPKDLNTLDKISKVIASYKRSGNIGEIFVAEDLEVDNIFY
jgi:hypothetical protein